MKQAKRLFSPQQKDTVQQAVTAAERRTSAEIVPVVATASGRYDRPEDMVGLWVGAIALIVAWAALPAASLESGNWGGLPPWQRLLAEAVAALGGFVAGAAIASRVAWLRRLFTPRRQMRDEVAARARTVFFDRRVHHTAGASGLLVYVSLYERMAILLADQSILDKVGQGSLDAWCAALTAALREGHPADAIAKAIALAGEKLGQVLPRATADVNELPDALVLLDG